MAQAPQRKGCPRHGHGVVRRLGHRTILLRSLEPPRPLPSILCHGKRWNGRMKKVAPWALAMKQPESHGRIAMRGIGLGDSFKQKQHVLVAVLCRSL